MKRAEALFREYEPELAKGFDEFFAQVEPNIKASVPPALMSNIRELSRMTWIYARTEFVLPPDTKEGA